MAQDTCILVPSVFLEVRWPLGTLRTYFGMLAHLRPATQPGIGVKWTCFGSGSNTRCRAVFCSHFGFFLLEMPDVFRFNLDFAL